MSCSFHLLFLGMAFVLLSEIQWTQSSHPKPTDSVEHALDHINKHPNSATMCAAILKFDCSQHIVTKDETVCGTDQVTYPDNCVFAKTRCQPSSDINLKHKGPCEVKSSPASHMTTILPSSVTWGHDPAYDLIKDVFCTNINLIKCGVNVDADICGSDGKVYTNQCLFAKVKCFKPDLEPTNPSKCHENGLPLKSTPKPFLVG
ncbi:agrin-like [Haliotis rubra]|uniref:agrin-like n=1 Tax=Haliotis rubra TaxID=36100 RepID=UPI001EE5DCBC|nr:agrin-like [Haliotis rubra]